MSATTTSSPVAQTGTRLWSFRVLAGLITLGMALTGGHSLVTGWTDPLDGGVHRLQELSWGVAEGLLLAVSLGWQLRRPQRHVDAMRVALAAVAAQLLVAVATLAPDPFGIVLLVLVGAAALTHPRRRELLHPHVVAEPVRVAGGALVALALLVFAAVQVRDHYRAGAHDLLEAKTGWVGAAIAAAGLALVVLLACLTGSRAGAAVSAAGLAVLGVASMLHPHLPSSFGTYGGAAAVVAALGAALLAVYGAQHERLSRHSSTSTPARTPTGRPSRRRTAPSFVRVGLD